MSSPASNLWSSAVAVLSGWEPTQPDARERAQQIRLRDDYLAFLDRHSNGVWRHCRAGHITASAMVVNESADRALLTLHPKVGRWLQLGGHCEPVDVSLDGAALREAREESGIDAVTLLPTPLRLDRHEVRCAGDLTWHLDVQYLARVPDDARARMSTESDDLRWWPMVALPDDLDASVMALIQDAKRAE